MSFPEYRKQIPITGASGAGTNYPIKLTVNSGTGTDGDGVVYLNGNAVDFPNDLRFADSDGKTAIPYWIDPVLSTSTSKIIWVRPSDDLSSGTQYIYIYYAKSWIYNNNLVSTAFTFGDDFNALSTAALHGQNGWTKAGSGTVNVVASDAVEGAKCVSIASGASVDTNAYHAVTLSDHLASFSVYMRDSVVNSGANIYASIYVKEGANVITAVGFQTGGFTHLKSGAWETFGPSASANTWYKITIDFPSKTTHRVFINDSLQTLTTDSNFTNISTAPNAVMLQRYSIATGAALFDLVTVRKKIVTEPTMGTSSAQESVNFGRAFSYVQSKMPGERVAGNPIIAHDLNAWKERQLSYPKVIENPWDSTQLLLYFNGGSFLTNNFDIGVATASKDDPETWTEYGSNPIIHTVTGFPAISGPDWVVYNEGENEIWLYASLYNALTVCTDIGLFKSSDGFSFTYYGSIMTISGDETYLGNGAGIIDGATWYYYYTYRTATATLPGIKYATSSDGVTWTKQTGKLISRGATGTYDAGYFEGLDAFKINDLYVLFYNSSDAESVTTAWTCSFAYSLFPTGPFTKDPNNPVFEKGASGEWDDGQASTACLYVGTNILFFYQGSHVTASTVFSVDPGTNVFTAAGHRLQRGDAVWVNATVSRPAPLAASTKYYAIDVTENTFKLSATEDGSEINITDTGSGTTYFLLPQTDGYINLLWDIGMTILSTPFLPSRATNIAGVIDPAGAGGVTF